ncbi:MAG: hypothetical protein MUP76_04570 [Acidimicrobiia bacterium]|nr:hypothetical protein [Acidimicrobiia bacterium]
MTVSHTQLSLTGEDDFDVHVRDEVLAIDVTQHTNGERVADLARLGYIVGPVLDPTYGYGSMWTHYKPDDLTICDSDPAKVPDEGTHEWTAAHVADFRDLPFESHSFGTVLYDPPYRFAGTPTDTGEGGHDDLYGTQVYRTKAEQMALILDGATECARVAEDYLIVKCQDQVVANSTRFQTTEVVDHVRLHGWLLKDRLHLISYRPQPAGRSQVNARNNFSTFLVFVPVF